MHRMLEISNLLNGVRFHTLCLLNIKNEGSPKCHILFEISLVRSITWWGFCYDCKQGCSCQWWDVKKMTGDGFYSYNMSVSKHIFYGFDLQIDFNFLVSPLIFYKQNYTTP